MNMKKRNSRRGFTFIEVVVSLTLLSVIVGAVVMVSSSSTTAMGFTTMRTSVQDKARRALDRVVDEVTNSSSTVMVPDPDGFGADDVLFQTVEGVTGQVIDWGPQKRLAFQYATGEVDDGLDNDGDGLVDEGVLVFTRDVGGPSQRTSVWCTNVRELLEGELPNGLDDNGNGLVDEAGFSIERNGNLLLIRLTVEKTNYRGDSAMNTVETAVRIQN